LVGEGKGQGELLVRLDHGTNGELRQSALWGKPGRGLVSVLVVALALTASTAASASSRYAYTTPGLLTSAKANPPQTFNVIIQGDANKTIRCHRLGRQERAEER
jgi:hypothetical protein